MLVRRLLSTAADGIRCHVSLEAVAVDRRGSALQHLLKDGSPVRGIASVLTATATDADGVRAAHSNGHTEVCVVASDRTSALGAVTAASELGLQARAMLPHQLTHETEGLARTIADLTAAGPLEAILMSVDAGSDVSMLRDVIDTACDTSPIGASMRSRIGLGVRPGSGGSDLRLVKACYHELELRHFLSCLAGKDAARPSNLLQALRVRPVDAAMGSLFLAEHVPDAA